MVMNPMVISFDVLPASDRQTDMPANAKVCCSIGECDKNRKKTGGNT